MTFFRLKHNTSVSAYHCPLKNKNSKKQRQKQKQNQTNTKQNKTNKNKTKQQQKHKEKHSLIIYFEPFIYYHECTTS